MKNYKYDVVFGVEHYEVYATNPVTAAILAVAKRIEEGKSTEIDEIYDVEAEQFVVYSCYLTLVESE